MNKNKKPTQHLVLGDDFSYRGERATFVEWVGYSRSTRYGVYRDVRVTNADGETVKWSLNLAGSVEVF